VSYCPGENSALFSSNLLCKKGGGEGSFQRGKGSTPWEGTRLYAGGGNTEEECLQPRFGGGRGTRPAKKKKKRIVCGEGKSWEGVAEREPTIMPIRREELNEDVAHRGSCPWMKLAFGVRERERGAAARRGRGRQFSKKKELKAASSKKKRKGKEKLVQKGRARTVTKGKPLNCLRKNFRRGKELLPSKKRAWTGAHCEHRQGRKKRRSRKTSSHRRKATPWEK